MIKEINQDIPDQEHLHQDSPINQVAVLNQYKEEKCHPVRLMDLVQGQVQIHDQEWVQVPMELEVEQDKDKAMQLDKDKAM